MKLLVAALAALVLAGVAAGSKPIQAITLIPGQAVIYGGMTCTAYTGTTKLNANMVCVRNDLKGYGVVISQQAVIVAKQNGSKFTVVFKGKNS